MTCFPCVFLPEKVRFALIMHGSDLDVLSVPIKNASFNIAHNTECAKVPEIERLFIQSQPIELPAIGAARSIIDYGMIGYSA
jgi:hypothetical protein